MGRNSTESGRKPEPSDKAKFLWIAEALLIETSRVLRREKYFPKRARWQYSYALMDIANAYHSQAEFANGIEVKTHGLMVQRYEAQSIALAWLYALDAKMSLAQKDLEIDADGLTHWTDLLIEAEKRTQNWRSSDLRRYEKQFGSLTAEELREPTVASYPAGVVSVRSPNPSNANNVRNSNPSGALNNNNANNTNGAVADREKAGIQ